jgi:hypothetical protein
MPDYVRVRDKETGHHYTITRERYDRTPELWQELKQPATTRNGDPLPPKYKTTVSTEAAKKASPTAATSEKKES